MGGKGFPGRPADERLDAGGRMHDFLRCFGCPAQEARLSATLLAAITAINSFHDFTKDLAPSS